jgi:DNA-binding response OmpR family regulator
MQIIPALQTYIYFDDNGHNMRKTILIIDDEQGIVDVCRDYLLAEGFDVLEASDGMAGLESARNNSPDLIVLDWMLPSMDGPSICKTLRKADDVPIIMLTAKGEENDRIQGFECGADDYICKPFSPRELVSRVKSLLKRSSGIVTTDQVKISDLILDRKRYLVILPGKEVSLTQTEFELMSILVAHPGRIFSRGQLLAELRGVNFESYERAIDSQIRNLRKKIEPKENETKYIQTMYGVGYKFIEK